MDPSNYNTIASEICFKGVFIRGTDLGFDKDEIKTQSTDDLVLLKKSILSYIHSKRLKKKNHSFVQIYKRIKQELNLREGLPVEVKEPVREVKEKFLKKKTTPPTQLKFEIPSFLHDKNTIKTVQPEKEKEDLKGNINFNPRIRKRTF
jgi:hypothetical protein